MSFDAAKVKRDFERAASVYDDHAGLQRLVMQALLAKAPGAIDGTWLDAGCGTGMLIPMLAQKKSSARIVSLDLAHAMCAHASERHNARAVNASLEALPIAPHSFDGAFCSLVLQWLNAPQAALAELYSVLKPGGTLLLATFGPQTLHELRAAFSMNDAYVHVSPFASLQDMRDIAQAAKLQTILAESVQYREHDASLLQLTSRLKRLGASNKWRARRKGMLTPQHLARVESCYLQRFGEAGRLPSTWEVHYLALRA